MDILPLIRILLNDSKPIYSPWNFCNRNVASLGFSFARTVLWRSHPNLIYLVLYNKLVMVAGNEMEIVNFYFIIRSFAENFDS